jgi:hypothetical protein
MTAFCWHRGRDDLARCDSAAAPRVSAPSLPVRKYYSARRRRFPLDAPAQCCGVSLPTLTSRGSAGGHLRTTDELQLRILRTRPYRCLLGAPNEVGEAGAAWLAGLEGLVRDLTTEWQLLIGRTLSGGTEALQQGGLAREDIARRWDKSTATVRTHAKTAAKPLFC